MGSNKYIIPNIKCWPVFKQDPSCLVLHVIRVVPHYGCRVSFGPSCSSHPVVSSRYRERLCAVLLPDCVVAVPYFVAVDINDSTLFCDSFS